MGPLFKIRVSNQGKRMWIVAVAWIYVVGLMAITEPNVVGGIMTFFGYCVLPLSILYYLAGSKQRRARQAGAQAAARANGPTAPDADVGNVDTGLVAAWPGSAIMGTDLNDTGRDADSARSANTGSVDSGTDADSRAAGGADCGTDAGSSAAGGAGSGADAGCGGGDAGGATGGDF
jgi:hypothetical protein